MNPSDEKGFYTLAFPFCMPESNSDGGVVCICIQESARANDSIRIIPLNILFSEQTSAVKRVVVQREGLCGGGRSSCSKMSNIRYIFKSDGTSSDLRFNTSPGAAGVVAGAPHLFGRDFP
ncbi:hypothetical protein TNIN_444831 [Trichonephila inaurata madagascariensis]|uniref:Uncharacterized protein n=1 Tax=Trichonephila inaurata madagascariensis TaxID=2747483 RepID=A0A8X6YWG7_9ARAC|nr:hypothetical protein TNIN_444831 [Trichonephila inaurata madagascariensis]